MNVEVTMENIKALTRVAEIEKDRYQRSGDYSVTDLISPPRIVQLRKRYGDQEDQPLSSIIPALIGTFIHEGFEKYLRMWVAKHGYVDYTFEQELCQTIQDRKVSGRFDLKDGKDIYDFKSCKVWKKVFDPTLKEWHEQQNLYAYLCHLSGIEVDTINVIAIYKDWSEGMALRDKNMPQQQIVEYPLELWKWETTREFLDEKLSALISAEDADDANLPMCTPTDRWERFTGGHTVEYAILKTRDAKRATKVVRTSLDDAYAAARGMKGITNESCIEIRYSKRLRCENYCAVNSFCKEYEYYCGAKRSNTLNDYLPIWT
jgi:hypothetical protein